MHSGRRIRIKAGAGKGPLALLLAALLSACGGGSEPQSQSANGAAGADRNLASRLASRAEASGDGPATDLVLVNFKGDCSGLRARVFHRLSGQHFGVEDPAPCQNPAYAAPGNLYAGLLARATQGQLPLRELRQEVAAERLRVVESTGDCRVHHLQVDDAYVGQPLNYITAQGCSEVGMADDAELPTRMIAHYIRVGIEPIVAAAPYSPELTRCDHRVDAQTLGPTLATLAQGREGQINSRWQVVCLQPGTYAGPFTVSESHHLMLVAEQPGTVTLKTDQPISTSALGAALSVWYSSNIVLHNLDFENAHQFAYNPPDGDPRVNLQYAVALYMGYVRGGLVAQGQVRSGGKTGMWLHGASALRASALDISGAYFALTTAETELFGEGLTLTTRHPIEPVDEHAMTWLDSSAIVLKDTTLAPLTGRGFAAGRADPARNVTFLREVQARAPVDAWFQSNPQYGGLHLVLQGGYPADTVDFWDNPYNGGGASSDMSVARR